MKTRGRKSAPHASVLRMALAVVSALSITACGADASLSQSAESAAEKCAGVGREQAQLFSETPVELLEAHPTNEAAFARWDQNRFGPGGPRPIPPADARGDRLLALCYYGGLFPAFPKGPPSERGEEGDYTRLALTVDQADEVAVHRVGPRSMDTRSAPDPSD